MAINLREARVGEEEPEVVRRGSSDLVSAWSEIHTSLSVQKTTHSHATCGERNSIPDMLAQAWG